MSIAVVLSGEQGFQFILRQVIRLHAFAWQGNHSDEDLRRQPQEGFRSAGASGIVLIQQELDPAALTGFREQSLVRRRQVAAHERYRPSPALLPELDYIEESFDHDQTYEEDI